MQRHFRPVEKTVEYNGRIYRTRQVRLMPTPEEERRQARDFFGGLLAALALVSPLWLLILGSVYFAFGR